MSDAMVNKELVHITVFHVFICFMDLTVPRIILIFISYDFIANEKNVLLINVNRLCISQTSE